MAIKMAMFHWRRPSVSGPQVVHLGPPNRLATENTQGRQLRPAAEALPNSEVPLPHALPTLW